VPHNSRATYGGMTYNAVELMVILTNLAPSGRRGESCACPGAASRVAVWAPPARVAVRTLVRGYRRVPDGRPDDAQRRGWQCLVVPGSHGAGDGVAVPGMGA
jgi:hypothetical protein